MKLLLLIASTVIFTGCLTTQKATDFLKKKDKLDDVCAENFPVKDSIIKGDTVTVMDTLINTDTLETFETIRDTVHHTITLPGKTITKTKVITDTVVRRDRAKESALEDEVRDRDKTVGERDKEITALKEENTKFKKQRNNARRNLWILVLIVGIYVGLRIKRIVPF